uniref:Plastocyanin-like domain-containing protein n=1 Tax=Chrysotila carterae TaxID=13221 RepID=A0A7S4BW91_CHRCT
MGHLCLLLKVLLLITVVASNNEHGAPFVEPPAETSGSATIRFSEYLLHGPNGKSQLTRSFNSMFGGPSIHTSPGGTLRITVVNELAAEKFSTRGHVNGIRLIDTTNVHTHGLHVSPRAPGDDMFTEIDAGASHEYIFDIPKDHMPGTHWYHPHFHGSTALHTGGGAAGMLIVDDPPGYLPPEIESLKEIHMVIVHVNSQLMKVYSGMYEANCFTSGGSDTDCKDRYWGTQSGDGFNVLLVNGQYQPKLEITANRWHRVRMLFSSIDVAISPMLAGCQTKLLAKDGIYLHQAPRDVTRGFMGPGNRADWLISCPPGTWQLESKKKEGQALKFHCEAPLVTIVAVDRNDVACELPTFSVARPCYVVDLRQAVPTNSLNWVLGPTPFINGNVFSAGEHEHAAEISLGQVVDMEVSGVDEHPFHIHVNPFQLTEALSDSYEGYFQAGDWHDTIFTPGAAMRGRLNVDAFAGEMVVHCHFLAHEDFGMMHLINVVGQEGTHFAKAKEIDSTCYWDDEDFGEPKILQPGLLAHQRGRGSGIVCEQVWATRPSLSLAWSVHVHWLVRAFVSLTDFVVAL